jgi:hypothetical protein
MEIADLVIGAQFQATPVRDSRDYFRCPEQLKLQAVLAGMDYAQVQAEMPEVWALAGAGQGFETFAAAVRARQEIEVAMPKLTVQRASVLLWLVDSFRHSLQELRGNTKNYRQVAGWEEAFLRRLLPLWAIGLGSPSDHPSVASPKFLMNCTTEMIRRSVLPSMGLRI